MIDSNGGFIQKTKTVTGALRNVCSVIVIIFTVSWVYRMLFD